MWNNYAKIALRHLRRNGWYMAINIAGLGLALAFCIMSFTNYRYAHSYDQWHRDADRIFRIETYKSTNHMLHGVCPATLVQVLPEQVPAVETATQIDSRGLTIKHGDQVFNQQVHFVDENFLDVFDFPLVAGQARLADHNALLISEKMAEKFFGQENPIGQQLMLYADEPQPKLLTITGITKNCPKNSSIFFDFLTHPDNQLQGDKPVVYDFWKWFVDAAFVRLKDGTMAAQVEQSLQAYIAPQNQANPDWHAERYALEALPDMAMHARDVRWNNLRSGVPPSSIWGNIILAIMLLLTASLNFANTTIAIGNNRLREMGIRKVMGGTHGQLMRQLLSEAFLICLVALAFGMFLVKPMVSWYNATWQHLDLQVQYWGDPGLLAFLAIAVAGTTLLGGAYPAFYISAFNPSSIFRGALRFGGASLFSRIMMGAQVAISLTALVVGIGFANNADLQRHADVGYARQSLLGVELPDAQSFQAFHNAIRQNPGIEAVAGSRHHIGFSFRRLELSFQGQNSESMWLEAGKEYLDLVEARLKSGSGFTQTSDQAPGSEVLVNETFVREIAGGRDVLGQRLQFDTTTYQIAGVLQDFMIDSPFDRISPVVVHLVPQDQYRFCIAKTKPENLHAVYADMEKTWKQLFPFKPFTGFYQSEVVAEAIEVSNNIANTMLIFSVAILLLMVSGLFAIVSLNALKLFRNLAIRRVLGANAGQISYQLNRNFLVVMVFSVIAGALSGRTFALALMNSIFKTNAGVPPAVLVLSAACIILALFATIGFKIWQIWRANLAEALKAE